MTALTKPYDLGESFYVPEFEVRLAGEDLPLDVVRDVISVTYRDSIEEIDSFELLINNWDASKTLPKYLPASEPRFERLFDPGAKLTLKMGYLGDLRLMLTGTVTTLEPDFPQGGGPTLSVSGLNELHEFRTEQHTYAWENKRDSDIAQELGRMPRQRNRPGLGMQVRVNPAPHETAEPYVLMDNMHDIVFLLQRARRHGYEFVLREGDPGGGEPYLYFGPSESQPDRPTYELERGRTLVSFKPTVTTANQISEVVVHGWDRGSNRRIEGKAAWKDLYPAGPERSRMERLAEAFGNRKEIVTNQPVRTRAQANQRARDLLRDRLKGMVEASGRTVGLPDIRSGRNVAVSGFGPLLDGIYYVTESTHTISEGYQTEFKARREDGPG
jgi:phage protein D